MLSPLVPPRWRPLYWSQSALDDPAKMSPFFTDAGMKTMRSEADVKAAWTAMSADDRAAILKECADEAVAKSHADFCKMATQMGK